jgi:hypothetical protein
VTLVFIGDTWSTAWGSEGSLTIDNLFFTGLAFADADSHTLTVTFDNEVETWGTEGTLNVDNLLLMAAANCDGDRDVDLEDFAAFQRCFTGAGGVLTAGCECTDLDADEDVDLDDYELFLMAFDGAK